jgi:YHS domain-containing protein
MAVDFVCGSEVPEDTRYFSDYDNKIWYFCSAECKRNFDDHPDRFIRERTTRQLGLAE